MKKKNDTRRDETVDYSIFAKYPPGAGRNGSKFARDLDQAMFKTWGTISGAVGPKARDEQKADTHDQRKKPPRP
ncbi:MAG: hypothetical protein AAB403_12945 [Planctomycetota bacterium]